MYCWSRKSFKTVFAYVIYINKILCNNKFTFFCIKKYIYIYLYRDIYKPQVYIDGLSSTCGEPDKQTLPALPSSTQKWHHYVSAWHLHWLFSPDAGIKRASLFHAASVQCDVMCARMCSIKIINYFIIMIWTACYSFLWATASIISHSYTHLYFFYHNY